MKCPKCEEELEIINIAQNEGFVGLHPSDENAKLYVCTSRDCSNVGVVLCIPTESKD